MAGVAYLSQSVGTYAFSADAGRGPELGLQLYTLQRQVRAHLAETLHAVATIGFASVELSGFLGYPPARLVGAIRAAGLRCDTCHVWPQPDRGDPDLDANVERTADLLRNLGLSNVVMPFIRLPARLPARGPNEAFTPFLERLVQRLTTDDWAVNAEWMNTTAAAFKRCGVGFSYHNHNLEFAPISGKAIGLEILLAGTDPGLVSFELDAGWCASAGVDPADVLRRHQGRFRMMHIKNISQATPVNYVGVQASAPLDAGVIDWRRLLPTGVSCGVQRFYVEQEMTGTREPHVADVARSFQYLTDIGSQGTI